MAKRKFVSEGLAGIVRAKREYDRVLSSSKREVKLVFDNVVNRVYEKGDPEIISALYEFANKLLEGSGRGDLENLLKPSNSVEGESKLIYSIDEAISYWAENDKSKKGKRLTNRDYREIIGRAVDTHQIQRLEGPEGSFFSRSDFEDFVENYRDRMSSKKRKNRRTTAKNKVAKKDSLMPRVIEAMNSKTYSTPEEERERLNNLMKQYALSGRERQGYKLAFLKYHSKYSLK
jgi:hypothetical protein